MSQLVFIENNKAVTDSLTIAEMFSKGHDDVLKDIRKQVEYAGEEFSLGNFSESTYTNARGRVYPKFNLTEEAFTLVVFSYNTKEAVQAKIKFIQEFKRMREHIENNKVKVLDDRTALIQSLKLTAETAERADNLEKAFSSQQQKILEIEQKVEEQITLTSGEQRRLQKGVAYRVYEFTQDKQEAAKLFRELYREIKDRFGVASYKDVKQRELQSALRYIENWIPRKVS